MARISNKITKVTPKESVDEEKGVIENLENQDEIDGDEVVEIDGEDGAEGDEKADGNSESNSDLEGGESGHSAPESAVADSVIVSDREDALQYIEKGVWTENVILEILPWNSKRPVLTILGHRGLRA